MVLWIADVLRLFRFDSIWNETDWLLLVFRQSVK